MSQYAKAETIEFSVEWDGFTIGGEAEIEPGAPDEADMPGYGPSVWIFENTLTLDGKDADGIISDRVLDYVKKEVLRRYA